MSCLISLRYGAIQELLKMSIKRKLIATKYGLNCRKTDAIVSETKREFESSNFTRTQKIRITKLIENYERMGISSDEH